MKDLYKTLLQAATATARRYAKKTGSLIRYPFITQSDIAHDTYIIIAERHQTPDPDTIARASWEAVRRASRQQQRHDHQTTDGLDPPAPQSVEKSAEVREAITAAGPVAMLLSEGYTIREIAERQGISKTQAQREAAKARERVKKYFQQ